MPTSSPFPRYDGQRYDMDTSVGHQLVSLVALLRREAEARMAEHGLTDAQWKPLWLLKSGRANTAFELARAADIDAGAVTRLIDRLEGKGLVERTRSDADRRVVHLKLTAAGEAAVAQVPHVLAGLNNDLLEGFSEAEWKQLQKLLGRLAARGAELQAARAAR